MPEQTLKNNLAKLRRELDVAESLVEDTRRELADVADSIEHLLEAPEPDYASARADLETSALRFEARHPTFSRILSEVTDALAKLGF